MKKHIRNIALVFAVLFLLTPYLNISAYAADSSLPTGYEGEFVVIPDETTPPQVSYGGYAPAIPKTPLARSSTGPMYRWNALVSIMGGSCFSESWNYDLTVEYPIDRIEAIVRVYDDNNIAGSDEDCQYNSYTARASASCGTFSAVVKREVHGTHRWHEEGYEDMERASYAEN